MCACLLVTGVLMSGLNRREGNVIYAAKESDISKMKQTYQITLESINSGSRYMFTNVAQTEWREDWIPSVF